MNAHIFFTLPKVSHTTFAGGSGRVHSRANKILYSFASEQIKGLVRERDRVALSLQVTNGREYSHEPDPSPVF